MCRIWILLDIVSARPFCFLLSVAPSTSISFVHSSVAPAQSKPGCKKSVLSMQRRRPKQNNNRNLPQEIVLLQPNAKQHRTPGGVGSKQSPPTCVPSLGFVQNTRSSLKHIKHIFCCRPAALWAAGNKQNSLPSHLNQHCLQPQISSTRSNLNPGEDDWNSANVCGFRLLAFSGIHQEAAGGRVQVSHRSQDVIRTQRPGTSKACRTVGALHP